MQWQGFVLVLAGAFLFALYETLNKKLIVRKLPADCAATVNFLGGGLLLFLVSLCFDPPQIKSWFDFREGLFWPLIATSLLNIVILFGNVRALKYGDVSLIAPIAATQPLVVILPSWLILRERPDAFGYFGLLLMAIGMYVFSFAEEIKNWQPPIWLSWLGSKARYFAPWQMLFRNRGVQIAVAVACSGAVSINFDKLSAFRSSATFAPACILFFCGFIGAVKTVREGEWHDFDKDHLLSLIAAPIVFAIVLVCYWAAFHYGMAAYVGAVKRTSAIFALFLGLVFLKEMKALKRWPGAVIMTAGAVLLSL